MPRPRVWTKYCTRREDCLSIDGHYGSCLIKIDGKLCWEDGRLAIGASKLTGRAVKKKPKRSHRDTKPSNKKAAAKKPNQLDIFKGGQE